MTDGGGPYDPGDTRPDARPIDPPFAPPPPPLAPPPSVFPPTAPPYAQPYTPTRTSGLAIASMVLGIVWVFWIGSILAVIFGHIALSQIKRSMGTVGGKGMAIAGLVLGYLGLASLIGVIAVAVIVGPTASEADCSADRSVLRLAEAQYFARNGHYTDEQTLADDGYTNGTSDLQSIKLVGGGPSSATGYVIVDDDPCD
jgi:Domain of unknown function (DUF4190)